MTSLCDRSSVRLTAAEFDELKVCFRNLGDRLTDGQMLELADCYHELLRQRRDVRARHPRACGEGPWGFQPVEPALA